MVGKTLPMLQKDLKIFEKITKYISFIHLKLALVLTPKY